MAQLRNPQPTPSSEAASPPLHTLQSGARRRRLESLAGCSATLLFYAPPHALGAVLADMVAAFGGERRCSVARELTKRHEEHFRCACRWCVCVCV